MEIEKKLPKETVTRHLGSARLQPKSKTKFATKIKGLEFLALPVSNGNWKQSLPAETGTICPSSIKVEDKDCNKDQRIIIFGAARLQSELKTKFAYRNWN